MRSHARIRAFKQRLQDQELPPDLQDSLDSHIQGLPQELQDTILEFTDAFHVPAYVHIDWSYKPPVALQLNQKWRARFAKTYYSDTTTFAGRLWGHHPRMWLSSLENEHSNMVDVENRIRACEIMARHRLVSSLVRI
jgi:hypothetical protein